MAPPLPHADGARPSLERGGLSSTHRRGEVRLRESWPRFESIIPALFWGRLVRGAAVHGLRSPGSAFGFGIEIHRLRRSHPSIP